LLCVAASWFGAADFNWTFSVANALMAVIITPAHVSAVDGRRRTKRAGCIVSEGVIKILRHGAVMA